MNSDELLIATTGIILALYIISYQLSEIKKEMRYSNILREEQNKKQ